MSVIDELNALANERMDNAMITRVMTNDGLTPYGQGVFPNPFADKQKEWVRRREFAYELTKITDKIDSLFEPRFITPPETSELIASIITASGVLRVLELGTCTGFTTLHMLRALYGKPGASIVTVDARPAHDRKFFEQFPIIRFVEGWTPQVLNGIVGAPFELVFVDSDHSVEHTAIELAALWPITKQGTIFLFHDLPEWHTPENQKAVPVRDYLFSKVADGTFQGGVLPTCEQLDCLAVWGPGYPPQCNPHLGIFIRR